MNRLQQNLLNQRRHAGQMTNNGLAKLLSVEFVTAAVSLVFLLGGSYAVISGGIEKNLEVNIRQDSRIENLQETQIQTREAIAEIKTFQAYQIKNQEQIRADITRMLDILEERRQ